MNRRERLHATRVLNKIEALYNDIHNALVSPTFFPDPDISLRQYIITIKDRLNTILDEAYEEEGTD